MQQQIRTLQKDSDNYIRVKEDYDHLLEDFDREQQIAQDLDRRAKDAESAVSRLKSEIATHKEVILG
jgi:uncharacterized protein YlxW (UPF0749 family)